MSDEDRELSRTILRGMREIVATAPKKKALIPPDLERCQAEKPNGHTFMTLGGSPGRERCKDKPTVIVKEKKPGKDGQCGSMTLCTRRLDHPGGGGLPPTTG
jgi:hypothetical protein